MRLPEAFEIFHDRIALGFQSEERINRAWGRLHGYLTEKLNLPPQSVFIQGSYANDTAVKPADEEGEYDLDIVSVNVEPGISANAAIEEMTDVLAEDGDLRKRIEPNETGRPCVRLRYADDAEGFGFHVDVVPARGDDPQEVLEVPMRGFEGWRESNPYRYTLWCYEQAERSVRFPRVVRYAKRWRDGQESSSIASIVLQVLIAENLDPALGSDAEAVVGVLGSMRQQLAQSPDEPPEILNPVLLSENLADRWDAEDYRKFRDELEEAVNLATEALYAGDEEESHALWVRLFGSDFPGSPAEVDKPSGGTPPPPPPDFPDERQQAPTDERYG